MPLQLCPRAETPWSFSRSKTSLRGRPCCKKSAKSRY
jgi:hypothetical protein